MGWRWDETTKKGSAAHFLFIMYEIWWDCMAEKMGSVTNKLFPMGWYVCNEKHIKIGSATHFLFIMEQGMMKCIVEKGAVRLTSYSSWDENLMREKGGVTHTLFIVGWDLMVIPTRKGSVTHRLLAMVWDCLVGKKGIVAHILLVI